MADCGGHGELRADGCECERLWYGEECESSFRDATGWAFSFVQLLTVVPYVVLLWSTLRQLTHVYATRDLKLVVQVLLFLSCSTLLVWLVDPYAFSGRLSDPVALLTLAVATMSMLMASTVTVIHWRQLLHTNKQSNVLEGGYLYVTLVLWVGVLVVAAVLAVHFLVTEDPRDPAIMNVIISGLLFSQTLVLCNAAFKLRKVVRGLGPSSVAKLAALAHMWTLLGVAGSVMTVSMLIFVALGWDEEPWAWFVVIMVVVRGGTLVILLVLYAATAATPVPTAHHVIRAILRLLCLWLPRNNVLPLVSAWPAGSEPTTAPVAYVPGLRSPQAPSE